MESTATMERGVLMLSLTGMVLDMWEDTMVELDTMVDTGVSFEIFDQYQYWVKLNCFFTTSKLSLG